MDTNRWSQICCVIAASVVAACSTHRAAGTSKQRAADASVEAGKGAPRSGASKDSGNPPIIFAEAGGVPPVGSPDGAAYCAADVHEAEARKLDLLILMDGSGSMKDDVDGGGRKWDLIVDAIRAFVDDPRSAGIGVALTYFGIPAGYDAGDLVVSCNVTDYVDPAVAMGDLPGNASSLVDSLSAYLPIGGTPTRPALAGAREYGSAWLMQHPTHRMAIVVATDGIPNDCDSTVASVAAIAETSATASPSVPVYVIGVGASLTSLDQIARSGGTGSAYIVDTSGNTTSSFVTAMNAIRGEAVLPCEYQIPSAPGGETVDYGRVNVAFTASNDGGSGVRTVLFQVPDAAACTTVPTGWYYDDPSSPQSIELCGGACTRAEADLAGRVEVLVGCKTQSIVPA